ncbi:reverse transcriptase domain-containing protein, partial [Thiolapillus sp.]
MLFVLYTQPLSKIIQHHSLYHHSFSDDNQLYISANLAQLQEIIRTSQSCISDVQAWMHNNKLQLNPDKTEMILITSKHNQKSLSLPFSVDLNGTSIHLSSTVRNLGVTLDQNLSFQQHVSRTCQICYFELRRINSIRHYLSQDALKTL